ncbi:MAG: DivIVA domain-containing protein, partial [Clostridia bacterium]|nr:DivIVA domain-containing protein [Clostridia bacterium]
MMVPNQIKMQSFSPAGRGMYKSNEVDAFMQRIYASYNELYNENAELKKKFASLRDIIEEYNAGKNAIATALVKAQTVADQTVESAKNAYDAMIADGEKKAKALVDEKTKEAE